MRSLHCLAFSRLSLPLKIEVRLIEHLGGLDWDCQWISAVMSHRSEISFYIILLQVLSFTEVFSRCFLNVSVMSRVTVRYSWIIWRGAIGLPVGAHYSFHLSVPFINRYYLESSICSILSWGSIFFLMKYYESIYIWGPVSIRDHRELSGQWMLQLFPVSVRTPAFMNGVRHWTCTFLVDSIHEQFYPIATDAMEFNNQEKGFRTVLLPIIHENIQEFHQQRIDNY